MSRNNSCLEGYECPECGSEGPFDITTMLKVKFQWSDEGAEDIEPVDDPSLDDDDDCVCCECGYRRLVRHFKKQEEE